MSKNVYKQDTIVQRKHREELNGHKSKVLWFTGLSGSGKSTIASHLHNRLNSEGIHSYMLDGDNIRLGINNDLDFTDLGRKENIRRISEIAKLFADAGVVVLTSFISPFREDRSNAKDIIGEADFVEVFVDCPLEVCEQRDVKGLYARARAGEIKHFTGIDSPYEEPQNPDIVVHSDTDDLEECTVKIFKELIKHIK
ncbi:MAG: adenylyl-sulfate kinase [Bacteroidia bacterium]